MPSSILELSTLPVELLHCIFRQLDPAALIATSQTCTYFRSIIQPVRKHFAERLLALEIEPEHGGPGFTYFARRDVLEPDWNEDAWERMRWACTQCLRLLPHAAFDNRSLLRLKNRKPTPGSPAAKMYSGVTSWEPVEERALSAKEERRKRVLVAEEKKQEKLLKKQYHMATTKTLNETQSTYTNRSTTSNLIAAELPEALELFASQLDSLTEGQENALLDRAARRIEGLRAGSHRHLRKCNECRFQLGHFKKGPFISPRVQPADGRVHWAFNNNKGTPEIPIVRARRLKFTTPFDRYFPGIEAYMAAERPDFNLPLWRIYREDRGYTINTLHMARCPSCATWQELRAFRWRPRGWGYGEFIGVGGWMTETEVAAHSEEVNNMQCNRCVQDRLGHAVLAKQLSAFMKELLHVECRAVLDVLSSCWHTLQYPPVKAKHEHLFPIKHLLKGLKAAQKKFARVEGIEGGSDIDVESSDVEDNLALINRRRLEWLHISKEEKEMASACVAESQFFGVWQDSWDEAIGYWRCLQAWAAENEQEPERVVRWALERRAVELR